MKYKTHDGIEVDAVQFNRDFPPESVEMVPREEAAARMGKDLSEVTKSVGYTMTKADGMQPIANGTWIITHPSGERSLCHPSVFASQFEPQE